MGRPRKPCASCGGPKPEGRGVRLCDRCIKGRRTRRGQSPCRDCGGFEGKQRGQQLCDDCKQLVAWKRARRKLAVGRKPCSRCGRPKGEGKRRRLCDRCRAESVSAPQCRKCKEQPVRKKYAVLCEECHRASIDRRRVRHRKYQARRRQNPVVRERLRAAAAARWKARDRVQRERELENRRIWWAAKRGRREAPVGLAPVRGPKVTVPGRPLADAIDQLARWNGSRIGTDEPALDLVCERAGVDVRTVYAWREYERGATLMQADAVLTRLDLFWWEVWSEETVRRPALVVHRYTYWKRQRGTGRVRTRSRPYGDLGSDPAELQRIEHLMEGTTADGVDEVAA